MTKSFLDLTKEKIIIFDDAMGTSIQTYPLSLDEFEGKDGCNEILVTTKPEIIKEIHASFLKVGCDVIETNSFGSNSIVLGEYDTRYETARFVNSIPSKKVYIMQNHIMTMVIPGKIYGTRFRLIAEVLE